MNSVRFCLVAVLLVMSASGVQGSLMNNSANWEGKYECDVLPNAGGFTPWSLATTYTTLNSGTITIDTYDLNVAGGWNKEGVGFDFTKGATVEIRAKMAVGQHRSSAWLSLEDRTLGKMSMIGLETVGPQSLGKPGGLWVEGAGWYWMNVNDWHTYRVVVDNSLTKPVQVYVDGVALPFAANYAATVMNKSLYFGDLSSTNDSEYEIDYIRWTKQGAYVPVPEPMTIGFMLFGLAGGLMRRK